VFSGSNQGSDIRSIAGGIIFERSIITPEFKFWRTKQRSPNSERRVRALHESEATYRHRGGKMKKLILSLSALLRFFAAEGDIA
jgi:hypothetical protein